MIVRMITPAFVYITARPYEMWSKKRKNTLSSAFVFLYGCTAQLPLPQACRLRPSSRIDVSVTVPVLCCDRISGKPEHLKLCYPRTSGVLLVLLRCIHFPFYIQLAAKAICTQTKVTEEQLPRANFNEFQLATWKPLITKVNEEG